MVLCQIVNTCELCVSSASGLGIDDLVAAVATTAMALPHVNQTIPKAYVDLGSSLQNWGRGLIASGVPPMCSRSAVLERVSRSPELALTLSSSGITDRALKFHSDGGVVVLAHNGDTVILDPMWLADTLACVVTVDPGRRAVLPSDLLLRGQLPHDEASLAVVWPDSQGYTPALRGTLLALLHQFGLAFEMRDKDDESLGRSVVPSMLPCDTLWGGVSADDLLGPLTSGDTEAIVEYRLECTPADLWALLLVRCAALAMPSACTSSVAVLQLDGQRACLSLDPTSSKLSCVCRGRAPVELRSRVHSLVTGLLGDKFAGLLADDAVSVACGVCKRLNMLNPLMKVMAARGDALFCGYDCLGEVALEVLDVVESPEATLGKLVGRLEAGDTGVRAEHMSALAARVCDKVFGLACRSHPRLWLPSGTRSGGWMWICEDPSGWHVGGEISVSHGEPVPEALAPLLYLLARAVRATSRRLDLGRITMDACCTSLAGSGGALSAVFPVHTPADVALYMALTGSLAMTLEHGKPVWCADRTLLGRHGHWACAAHAAEEASLAMIASPASHVDASGELLITALPTVA